MRLRAIALVFLTLTAFACGPKSMKQRMHDSERLADKCTVALDDAEKAGNDNDPDKMDKALLVAKDLMLEKDIELYPEAGMLGDRLIELQKKAPGVRAERDRIDLEKKMTAAREKIVPKMAALREALDGLVPDAPTSEQVEAVQKAADKARADIEEVKELLSKNADFAAWAKSQRTKTERALDGLKLVKKKVKFLEGPVADRTAAAKLFKDAKKSKDPDDKLKMLSDAVDKYKACVKDGEKQTQDQELATASIALNGRPTAPLTVVSGCKDDLESVKTELDKVKDAAGKKKPAEASKKKKKK